MKVIQGQKKIIKSWCDSPEEGAVEQARVLADLPFIFRHVALMPDTHLGYGMPIGGVIATEGVVIPNAVGVDIGCGMCAMKSNHTYKVGKDTLKAIMGAVRRVVPMGKGKYCKTPAIEMPSGEHTAVADSEYQSALYQLGSLGGGNHFVEIQRDQDGFLWIMVHSGSRNIGYKIAQHYNKLAQDYHKEWHIDSPKNLAWLPANSDVGQDYINDMNYATDFAFLSRRKMMYRTMEVVVNCIAKYEGVDVSFPFEMINIHHNFARQENHFGKNVWVHRKGATSARKGEIGIIPGSQGANSYIVEGLGNSESFESCSHGAGRKMGRKDAQRRLNLEDEIKKLDDLGVIHGVRNVKDLDEADGAYKDIETVMKEQRDLVKIVHKLTPICAMKG